MTRREKIVKILISHDYDSFSQDTPVSCICGKDCHKGKGVKERIANHIVDLIEELDK